MLNPSLLDEITRYLQNPTDDGTHGLSYAYGQATGLLNAVLTATGRATVPLVTIDNPAKGNPT